MALTTFVEGRLWGVRHGAGEPWVLALPGWGRDHRDFDDVLAGLDAIALDLPGHGGAAPEPPEAWTTARYAEWVAPVLEEMARPVVVLGHSFGGRVGLHLAGAHPDAVGALVISGTPLAADPSGRPSRPARAYRLVRRLHRWGLVDEERMERARRRHGSADYRAASPGMRAVLVAAVGETASGAYLPVLARFPGAVELVWGEQDDQAPLAGLRAAASARPDAAVVVLPGVGHFTVRQAPGALRAAVLRHGPPGPSPS